MWDSSHTHTHHTINQIGASHFLPSSHTKSSSLFVIMEPIIFTYSFTINGYDVAVIIKFFPHIVVLEDFSPELTDDESESVDIFFNL